MRTRALAILVTLAATLVASEASSQQRRILGKVTDMGGLALEGVEVTATIIGKEGQRKKTDSGKKGDFSLLYLVGVEEKVSLRFAKDGFAPYLTEATLPWADSITLDIKLESMAAVEARRAAEEAKLAPDPADVHNAGVEATKTGDWAAAAAKFKEALAIKEDEPATHAAIATAYWNLKEYANAETHARRALEIKPAQEEMNALLAYALEAQGKKEEAAQALTKVAESDPKLRAQLAFNRGAEFANAKKDPEALAAFEEAANADPTLAEAQYAVGVTAFRTGDMAKSKAHLTRYLELSPEGKNAKTASELLKAIPATSAAAAPAKAPAKVPATAPATAPATRPAATTPPKKK